MENRDKFEEFLDLYSLDLEELYDEDDDCDEDDEEEEGYEDDVYR